MFSLTSLFKSSPKNKEKEFEKVAKQQLNKNVHVIESLRDYDTGKKDISTDNIKERLPDIQVTP